MAANRLGKGTVDTNSKIVYTVPLDFVTIVKTISLCNIGSNDIEVSVLLDGVPIVKNETIKPDDIFNKSVFDHFIKSNEDITIEVDRTNYCTYYISGKEAPIDDIGNEKAWMRSVWEEWWQDEGPVMFEQDFNDWWKANGPDDMEKTWQDWFDYIQNATYVDKNDFDIKMADFTEQFNNLESDINQALLDIQNQVNFEISEMKSEFNYLEDQLKAQVDNYTEDNETIQSFRMWGEL